jgi:hypothetical protein
MKQFASDIERRIPEPWAAAGRTRQPPAAWLRMPRWYSLRPGAFFRPPLAHRRQQRHDGRRIGAHQPVQGLADELVEGHHHRHRVSRQPEQPGTAIGIAGSAADAAKGQRPPGLHGDLPEQDFAQFAISGLTKSASPTDTPPLLITTSAAAAAWRKVVGEQRRIVGDDAEVEQLAAQAGEHAEQGVTVAVVDLAVASGVPIEHSSSPVEKKATRRRRKTLTSAKPSEAISPSSAGRSADPAVSAGRRAPDPRPPGGCSGPGAGRPG